MVNIRGPWDRSGARAKKIFVYKKGRIVLLSSAFDGPTRESSKASYFLPVVGASKRQAASRHSGRTRETGGG